MSNIYLEVFLQHKNKKLRVGELAGVKERIYFEYDDNFIKQGIEISPFHLPLRKGLQEEKQQVFQGLHGVFNDSLPDGWGLLLMDRYFRKQGLNPEIISPLTRLAFIGERGMGALTYHPVIKFKENLQEQLNLMELAQTCEKIITGKTNEVLPQLMIAGGSPAGARPKVLIGYNANNDEICSGTAKLPKGFEPYLVKFHTKQEENDISNVEYAYALMAEQAGLELREVRMFEADKIGQFFAIKRFDRKNNHRIHMHTLGGLIHADHRLPCCDYVDFLKATWLLTKNHNDVVKAFRRMVFNVLAHNRDDHVKNFSFLLTEKGWQLAPAYDLVFSHGLAGQHTMTIMGEGVKPNQEDMLKVATKLNIKQKAAKLIIAQVRETAANWLTFAKQAGVKKTVAKQIAKVCNNVM
jgi:serine/threonine-protein kinase HipA